jgi:uncharacterized protein YihD (DUF1040 family)
MKISSIVKVVKNALSVGLMLIVLVIVLALAFWAINKVNQSYKDKPYKTLFQSLAQEQGFSHELENFNVRSINFSIKVCESDCPEGIPTLNVEVKEPKVLRDGDIGSFVLLKSAFPSLFPEDLESYTYAHKCVEGYLRKANSDGSRSVFKPFYTFTYEYCLPKDEKSQTNKASDLCLTDRVMGNSKLFAGDCKTRFLGWLVPDKE